MNFIAPLLFLGGEESGACRTKGWLSLDHAKIKMRKNQLHNIDNLRERRKELRSNLTSAEAFLWKYLKSSQLEGRKFRRQHSFGKFILDFYCSTEKLGVELDGMYHFNEEQIIYDEERTKYFENMGIKVIRFENVEVFEKTEEVLSKIKNCFKSNLPVTS